MSFVDMLRAAANTAQVEFNVFLSTFQPTGNALWAFVEGRDDLTFYSVQLKRLVPTSVGLHFVKAGTKNTVVKWCCDFVSRFGPNPRGMFFVDRDIDVLLDRKCDCVRLFVTRWYSIENEACTDEAIVNYCVECLGVPSDAPVIGAFVTQFKTAWAQFLYVSQFFTAWLVAVRRLSLQANINNIDFGKLFHVNSESALPEPRLSLQDSLAYLHNVSGGSTPLSEIPSSVLDSALADVSNGDLHALIRGKQAVWFLVRYLDIAESRARDAGHSLARRVNLNSANAVEIFSTRIAVPADLKSYMDATIEALRLK